MPNHETHTAGPPVGLSFLLSQVGAHAAFGFTERITRFDLKPHDAGVLRMLGSSPGLTQQALSKIMGVFPSQLVALLDGLESRGLVERRSSPADRRRYQLHLTHAGRRMLAAIGKLTLKLESDLFAALSEEERVLLVQMLKRVVAQQQITPGVHPAYRQLGKP